MDVISNNTFSLTHPDDAWASCLMVTYGQKQLAKDLLDALHQGEKDPALNVLEKIISGKKRIDRFELGAPWRHLLRLAVSWGHCEMALAMRTVLARHTVHVGFEGDLILSVISRVRLPPDVLQKLIKPEKRLPTAVDLVKTLSDDQSDLFGHYCQSLADHELNVSLLSVFEAFTQPGDWPPEVVRDKVKMLTPLVKSLVEQKILRDKLQDVSCPPPKPSKM